MSLLAATQIPKPSDDQAFERASIVLWRCLLSDPNVSRHGRSGQRQNGVDLVGLRNGDPAHIVGIQCKLKGAGQVLTEKEIRIEVDKALTFSPALREYFITTTAPDDVGLHQLAREIAVDLETKGHRLLIHVWGWNILEERITEYSEARNAFDPDFTPFSKKILEKQCENNADIKTLKAGLVDLAASLTRIEAAPSDLTTAANVLEKNLDAEIDGLRELALGGKPRTALSMFERLLARVEEAASGRILFRVKANIGHCLLALGEDEKAVQLLMQAFAHAPAEPKAITNKALSLLLNGDWKELLTFGSEALRADPTNDSLASYFVQAARFDNAIIEPLNLLPEQVKDSAAVAISWVDFLRYRGRIPDWWQAARDAVAAHPGDYFAQRVAAEADLDEILSDSHFQRTALFREGEKSRVIAASNVLLQQWNKAREGEGIVRPENVVLCGNLVVAYHALDDLPRAIEIARQGLSVAPSDTALAIRAATVAIDGGDETLVREMLPRLPAGPDAAILKFRFYAQRGEWDKVAELCRTDAANIPADERVMVTATGRLAEVKLSSGENAEGRLMAIAKEVADDPRASIVVANFAMLEGYGKLGDDAYQNALQKIDVTSHISRRLMVAMHAAKRGDWENVADLLDGHIDEEHDSEELRTLMTALVNEIPIRKRAIRLIAKLPVEISALPFYLHTAGLIHFNRGDLKQAKAIFRKTIEASPTLTNYLALFATLRRMDQQKEIASILTSLDIATLEGTPGQKMFFAQELGIAGQKDRALRYAYDVLTQAPNDPEAALRYFGLLMSDHAGYMIPSMLTANVDAWVRLEGENGDRFEFIIEEGENRPANGILSPKHKLAAAVLGLKVGAAFEQEHEIGCKITWRVAEIKHKYLHALHDVMENFQTRFPDAKGIYRFTTRDGDVQPILDQVKEIAEMNRGLADLYLLQHFPLGMVASRLGKDSVGFADYIKSLGANIEVCVGVEPERLAAQNMIRLHRTCGVVLDAYTAWTVATMDVFDILDAVFGKVIVPQSVIDELHILKGRDEPLTERFMTIAWHDGQFFRYEATQKEIEARAHFISEQIKKVENNCQIESVAAPDSPTELATLLTQAFGAHVLDVANLAAEGYILLSEDIYFRQIANATISVKGVWLQVVLAFARNNAMITRERYADAIVKLAVRRHSYLSLDAATLWDIFLLDTVDLDQFRAVSEFIGTKDADISSHMLVASEFLMRIWSSANCMEQKGKSATGILLSHLIRHHLHDNWAVMLASIKGRSNQRLREYVDGWVQGHFLPMDRLEEADLEIAQIRTALHVRKD